MKKHRPDRWGIAVTGRGRRITLGGVMGPAAQAADSNPTVAADRLRRPLNLGVGPHLMDASRRKPWVRAALLAGVGYFVVGYGSAALDPSVPDRARFAWRLAAWAVSAVVFAAHIGYEHFRLGDSPLGIALHTAEAVALGAFLIAVAATVHAATVASHAPYWRFLLALVLWPIFTALPAFLVALVAGAVLARLPRGA